MAHGRSYSNGTITVVWQPDLCIHSAICVSGLPAVFKPGESPWIRIDAAASDAIAAQVRACPSGALSLRETPAPVGHDD